MCLFGTYYLDAISGWLDCPAFGEPIDKIIPSKVPLDETFNESVPPGKRYSSKQLVNKQRKAGRDVSVACLFVLADHTLVSPTGYCTDYYGGTMAGNLLALPAHPSHCSTVQL